MKSNIKFLAAAVAVAASITAASAADAGFYNSKLALIRPAGPGVDAVISMTAAEYSTKGALVAGHRGVTSDRPALAAAHYNSRSHLLGMQPPSEIELAPVK